MNPKRSVYGPDQFTEEDVLAVARELEKEDPAKPGEQEDAMSGDDDDRSKSDSCQKKRCSQCQVVSSRPGAELLFIRLVSSWTGFHPPCCGLPGLLARPLSKVLAPATGKYCKYCEPL